MSKEILDSVDVNNFNIDEIEAGLCKDSFYYFVKQFWETFDTSTPIWNWHIQYICQELQVEAMKLIRDEKQDYDYIAISLPPGIGKSNILLLLNAWVWTHKPSIKVIGASYSMSISARDLSYKARVIVTHEKYKRYFPYITIKNDKSAESDFHNTNGGYRFSSAPDATITGKRYDLGIIDDILNSQDSYSQKERDKSNKFGDEFSTRKVRPGYSMTVVSGQRLHREDFIGHILAQGLKVKYICIPAEYNRSLIPSKLKRFYDQKDGLLFPERYSRESLDTERKKNLRVYNAQFLQNPSDDSDSLLKEANFEIVSMEDYFRISGNAVVNFAIDTANTANRSRNDPSTILAGSKIGNDLYITGLSKKWFETPQMIEHIKNYVSFNGYTHQSKVFIEPAQSGYAILQLLKKDTGLNVIYSTSQNKFSKHERLEYISSTVQAGRVKLVKDNWNKEFLSEVCVPESEHDDIKDALCILVNETLLKPRGTGKYNIAWA